MQKAACKRALSRQRNQNVEWRDNRRVTNRLSRPVGILYSHSILYTLREARSDNLCKCPVEVENREHTRE